MSSRQKVNFKTEKALQEAILREKAREILDLEIGQKYGVTFRYIERLITKAKGINVSALKVPKKGETLHPKISKRSKLQSGVLDKGVIGQLIVENTEAIGLFIFQEM